MASCWQPILPLGHYLPICSQVYLWCAPDSSQSQAQMLMSWMRQGLLIFPCRLSNSCQIRTLKVTPGWVQSLCLTQLRVSYSPQPHQQDIWVMGLWRFMTTHPLSPGSKLVITCQQQSLARVWKWEVKLNQELVTEQDHDKLTKKGT